MYSHWHWHASSQQYNDSGATTTNRLNQHAIIKRSWLIQLINNHDHSMRSGAPVTAALMHLTLTSDAQKAEA
jgi:hypothetical protein